MVYIAKENIGDYKKGDEVPAELAEIWMNMYAKSPVTKTKATPSVPAPKVVTEEIKVEDTK